MTFNLKVVSIFNCPLGLIETTAFNFFWFALPKVAQVEHEIRQWTSWWLDILPIKTESFEVWTEFHSLFPLGPTAGLPNFNLKLGNEHFFSESLKITSNVSTFLKLAKNKLFGFTTFDIFELLRQIAEIHLENLTVILRAKIQISKWDFFIDFQALFTHCSKSSFFVQKFNFLIKLSGFFLGEKLVKSGFGLFSCWQLWFHEKNCQTIFGW